MGSTFLSLNLHIVFATKEHRRIIDAEWRSALHAYLGGCLSRVKAVPIEINGVEEHVHLLAGMRATHRLCDVLREIKSVSSNWVHDTIGLRSFDWQDGYSAFSVDWRGVAKVRDYIRRQEEHHRRISFRDEYLALLREHEIAFDPRYVF